MALPALSRLYRRLGRRYPYVFLTIELQSAFAVTAATLALFSFYYNASTADYLRIAIIPTCIWAVAVLDLDWPAFFPLFAGSLVALGYSAILHYLILEAGMRPVLLDINAGEEGPRLRTPTAAVPLRLRLMTALPLINIITGLVVAALTSEGGGGAALGADVLIAVGVATTISLELTVLFAKSIVRPITDLQRATEAVREGRYDVAVPVTTGDELGELAASFNQMVEGLAERERLREAFGTYL